MTVCNTTPLASISRVFVHVVSLGDLCSQLLRLIASAYMLQINKPVEMNAT